MTTPYDVYVNELQKQAADALVPGHAGMGVNSGHMDSDAMEATSSALARNRADMQALALISGSADGGVGYSTPAPGTSPSLQMQADVKAAAVVDEAIKFAEHVYLLNKQAANEATIAEAVADAAAQGGADAPTGGVMNRLRGFGTAYMDAVKGAPGFKGRALQAAAIGVPVAAAGGLGYGAYNHFTQPAAAAPVPEDALKTAAAVLDALGLQAVQKSASTPGAAAGEAVPFLTRAKKQVVDAYAHLKQSPYATAAVATGGVGIGAGGVLGYNHFTQAPAPQVTPEMMAAKAASEGMWAKGVKALKGYGDQAGAYMGQHPFITAAGAGTLGVGAGALTMHQLAAHQQAAQMQAAQEAGLARPEDASLAAMKEASLLGQQFALQQMGLI